MKFTMTIDMDNAAFDDEPAVETVRILKATKTKLLDGETSGACRDLNGNRCGSWKVAR